MKLVTLHVAVSGQEMRQTLDRAGMLGVGFEFTNLTGSGQAEVVFAVPDTIFNLFASWYLGDDEVDVDDPDVLQALASG